MVYAQVNQLQRDIKETKHYVARLRKQGRGDLAYKMARKQQYLQGFIDHQTKH